MKTLEKRTAAENIKTLITCLAVKQFYSFEIIWYGARTYKKSWNNYSECGILQAWNIKGSVFRRHLFNKALFIIIEMKKIIKSLLANGEYPVK